MHAPNMHDHVRLTMGTAPWIECARDAHLVPLADKLKARGDGRMTPEIMAKLAVLPRKIQKRREHFVRVQWPWVEQLTKARHIATYRVALHVLYRHWKGGGKPFTLSNTAMGDHGVSWWRKWEALGESEQLGLIIVERRNRQSPRIVVIV
jgi:hypothetical protein